MKWFYEQQIVDDETRLRDQNAGYPQERGSFRLDERWEDCGSGHQVPSWNPFCDYCFREEIR